MARILVAYYSRGGYTRCVAEQLATRLGAELSPIHERRSRAGAWGYLRSAWEALKGREVEIENPARDPSGYELLVLGTPVWAGHASPPARTFARRFGTGAPRLALFCTMGGSGAAMALAELQQDARHTPLATLALTDREIDAGACELRLADFATLLASRLPPAPQMKAA